MEDGFLYWSAPELRAIGCSPGQRQEAPSTNKGVRVSRMMNRKSKAASWVLLLFLAAPVIFGTFEPGKLTQFFRCGAVTAYASAAKNIHPVRKILTITGNKAYVTAVAFSPDGKRLASGDDIAGVHLWDSSTGERLHALKGQTDQIDAVIFSADGRAVVAAGFDEAIRIWDASSGELKRTIISPRSVPNDLRRGDRSNITAMVLSPAGTLATVGLNGEIKFWNLETGNAVQELSDIAGICFSRDGRLMGTSKDDSVQIWEMASGRLLRSLTYKDGKLRARTKTMVFSPDGRFFASTGADMTIRIWETESGEVVQRLKGHTNGIAAIAYSPDGRYIVSGGGWFGSSGRDDIVVGLWDAGSGELVMSITDHSRAVASVAFSPDGKRLATAGLDGNIHVYECDL